MSEPTSTVQIRGYASYDRAASFPRRVLAHVTDLPIFLSGPVLGVFWLGQPPLPEWGTVTLWILWAGMLWFVQRRLFAQTLGERLWGIKHFKGQGCREKKSWSLTFQMTSLGALMLSLGVSSQMVLRTVAFHPMLRPAYEVQIPAFAPPPETQSDSKNWSLLPFYLTLGAYPRLWQGRGPQVRSPPGTT